MYYIIYITYNMHIIYYVHNIYYIYNIKPSYIIYLIKIKNNFGKIKVNFLKRIFT